MAKNKNSSSQKPIHNYLDLFYMTPNAITAKDIVLLFQGLKGIQTELWEELNILELVLPHGNSVDFEPLEVSFQDPSDAAFVKNRGVKNIFAINLSAEDLPIVIPFFEKLVEAYSGFVCADSADFTPVYAGTSKLVQ